MTPTSPWSSRLNSQQPSGFTLLELLLVLTILSLAATLIVPNLGALESRSFDAQVRQINSLLNYARRLAVVNGQPSTATITVNTEEEQEALSQIDFANRAGEWESEGTRIRFQDSTDQITDIEGSLDIIFYPEGGSTGGTLLISLEERMANIDIDPITGRISTEYPEDL